METAVYAELWASLQAWISGGHSFLLYIAMPLFFLPAVLFFSFFFCFPILVKSYLYLWESYMLVCIILADTQVLLDVNTLPPHVASKTLA